MEGICAINWIFVSWKQPRTTKGCTMLSDYKMIMNQKCGEFMKKGQFVGTLVRHIQQVPQS